MNEMLYLQQDRRTKCGEEAEQSCYRMYQRRYARQDSLRSCNPFGEPAPPINESPSDAGLPGSIPVI
jgi:ArsR family metal-binding transcriptional regulator